MDHFTERLKVQIGTLVDGITTKNGELWANGVRPHLNVMVCGKYGSLIPIQDKIDLTNAHEKNEEIPEETAVKIEKDNCDNDSGDKIEEFLETSSEVKVEESEADLVMVSLTPHDDLKTEEILNEAKIEEFNPIGIATISSNYI